MKALIIVALLAFTSANPPGRREKVPCVVRSLGGNDGGVSSRAIHSVTSSAVAVPVPEQHSAYSTNHNDPQNYFQQVRDTPEVRHPPLQPQPHFASSMEEGMNRNSEYDHHGVEPRGQVMSADDFPERATSTETGTGSRAVRVQPKTIPTMPDGDDFVMYDDQGNEYVEGDESFVPSTAKGANGQNFKYMGTLDDIRQGGGGGRGARGRETGPETGVRDEGVDEFPFRRPGNVGGRIRGGGGGGRYAGGRGGAGGRRRPVYTGGSDY